MSIGCKLRFEILKRDNFTCRYCGRKTPKVILEVDHVVPKAEGGEDEDDNLITSCFDCNRGKGKELLFTTIPESDIHEKAILLAERERQLKEYNTLRERVRKRENKDIEAIKTAYEEHIYGDMKYFPGAAVRAGLKVMGRADILDFLEIAVSTIKRRGANNGWDNSMSAYFAGILWNQIKGTDR